LVRDNEAEELGLGLAERTLGKFHLEVGSTEGGEHLLDLPQVILLSFGEDDEVVQEGQAGDTDEGTEDVVHEAHKGGGGIGGRTVNSKLPKLVLKAVLCMSAGSRRA
jgi:hypothetical protein